MHTIKRSPVLIGLINLILWQTLAGRCNSHFLDFILIVISDDDGGHFQALGRKLFKVFGTLLVVKVEEQESIGISPILKSF